MDMNNQKMKNRPLSPVLVHKYFYSSLRIHIVHM